MGAKTFALAMGLVVMGVVLGMDAGAQVEQPRSTADTLEGQVGEVIGSGNGSIHIIPALSALSVKNGGTLTIQAVVTSERPVLRVEARIEREGDVAAAVPVATVELRPAPSNLGGVSATGTAGLWQAEWTATGLEEASYSMSITAHDASGDTHVDRSLRFSDPVAGRNQVGSASYPNGGMRRLDAAYLRGEVALGSAVIDVAGGFAYFGTNSSPGRVVKVALGSGSTPPTREGALILQAGENLLRSAVIDPAGGFACFGTHTSPGRVVKVALGSGSNPPTRVGAVTLATGEDFLDSAVVDTASGHAWFGTDTSPGRVVKVTMGSGSNPPTRVGAATMEGGENGLLSAVIDGVGGHAYFGTATYPGRVVKVALGSGSNPPTRVGAVVLERAEFGLASAVIDAASGYAYFGTSGGYYPDLEPLYVVKVALGSGSNPPSRVGALVVSGGHDSLISAVIDTVSGHAYFGSNGGYVVKVALGGGSNPPTLVAKVMLGSGAIPAVIDSASGYAFFGLYGEPCRVVKVALGNGSTPPAEIGAVELEATEKSLVNAVVDVASGYAYFGTATSPGQVVKVALGEGSKPPIRVGAVTLESGENQLRCAVIDPASGFAYFGTGTYPGRVVKVALGSGTNPPTRVGAVTLGSGEDALERAVIDAAAGYAYFGTHTSPGRVVKVGLGHGLNPPTRVGAVTLHWGENSLSSAVIDVAAGHAYFGTRTFPGRVVKVALGSGSNPPERAGAVMLESGEDGLVSAVIDPAGGHAYFGTETSPGRVVKVALGRGSVPPARLGAVTLESGEKVLYSAVIDARSGHAYFATGFEDPARVVKVAFGNGGSPPYRVGAVTLESGEGSGFNSAIIDAASGHAYLAIGADGTSPGVVVRVGLSQQGFVKATRLTLPDAGSVTELRFFSHAARGNVRLALYDLAATPNLLWQSGVIPNTAARTWLSTSVAAGTPSTLDLPAGAYWLAWQVDTAIPVASHAVGVVGEGLLVPWTWGPFPPALDLASHAAPTPTDELWSAYLSYETLSTHTLTVDRTGTGSGTVSSTPAGITCGAFCTGLFPAGSSVILKADADPGSRFTGWSGACSRTGSCQVIMDTARTVSAEFTAQSEPVAVLFPGVASLEGSVGTRWRSEVALVNPGPAAQTVILEIIPRNTATVVRSATRDVAKDGLLRIPDVYSDLGAGSGAGTLRVSGDVLSWVRTFNDKGAGGTLGQDVPPAALPESFPPATDVLFPIATPASEATEFRSNLLVLNLEPTPITFTLTAGSASATRIVPGSTYTQIDRVGAILQLPPGLAVLKVQATGRWAGTVSSVDPGSGDPTTVRGLMATLHNVVLFPGVASVGGALGSRWRSEAVLFNPGMTAVNVLLEIVPRGGSVVAAGRSVPLDPQAVRRLADLYAELQAPEGAGLLRVTGAVLSWVRTYNQGTTATFGQDVPPVRPTGGVEAGSELLFPISRPQDVELGFRSNLILYNHGTATLMCTVTSGTRTRTTTVPAGAYVQVNDVGTWLGLPYGWATITVTANGRWSGTVSTIDPTTGDPTTVIGLVRPGA